MRKNGFTLIELLAVIIILAVIALIATPIVLNVVDSAKKSAAESSIRGYADAIKLARYEYVFANQGAEPADFATISSSVKVGGEAPTGCTVTLTNGEVSMTGCKVTSYSDTKTASYANNGTVTWAE